MGLAFTKIWQRLRLAKFISWVFPPWESPVLRKKFLGSENERSFMGKDDIFLQACGWPRNSLDIQLFW